MTTTPRTRRSLVALLLVASVVLPAVAHAGEAPLVSYRVPADEKPLTQSDPTFEFFIYFVPGLGEQDVVVTVKPVEPEGPELTYRRQVDATGKQCVPVKMPIDPPLAFNGRYEARVTTSGPVDAPLAPQSGDCAGATSEPRTFFIAAPPVSPTGVKAEVNPTSRAVTVSWAKNPEADVLRYQILRAKGTGGFVPFGVTDRQSFADGSSAEGGDFRYQVVALRRGARAGDPLVRSAPSAEVKATVVPAPPPAPVVARRGGGGTRGAPPLRSASPPDTSAFSQTLPFGEGGAELEPGEEAADVPEGFEEIGADEEGDNNRRSLAALAAGLLITVFVMHLLWIKGEVDREPLEAVNPE